MDSGADWTIIRASWFNQNFSEGYLLDPILDGYVTLPVANIGEPFIDADDIADVAVATLTEAGHTGQLYDRLAPVDLCRSRERNSPRYRQTHSTRTLFAD